MKQISNILLVDHPVGLQDFNNPNYQQFNIIQALTQFEIMMQFSNNEIAIVMINFQEAKINEFKIAKLLHQKCKSSDIPIIYFSHENIKNEDAIFVYKMGAIDILILPINHQILCYKFLSILKSRTDNGIQNKIGFYFNAKNEKNINAKFLKEYQESKKHLTISTYPELVILDINKSYLRKIGFEKDDIIGKTESEFSFLNNTEAYNLFFNQINKHKIIKDLEIKVQSKQGGVFNFLYSGEIISNNHKQYFISEVKDVDHFDATEKKIKELSFLRYEAQQLAHIGRWELDLIENTAHWSEEMFSIYDLKKSEFTGKFGNIIELIHPDDIGLYSKWIDSTMSTGGSVNIEYRIIHNNGSIHFIKMEGTIVLDKNGTAIKGYGIAHDITKRKQFELSLKISDDKFKTLLLASPDGIILKNMKGEITEVSEISLELLGVFDRNEVIGKQFSLFVPDDDILIFQKIIEKTINDGLVQNVELKLMKKNGTIFVSETSGTLIQDPDGIPISFMFIIRDISQRKKNEAKQLFADRMANLGEMASGMAHEINQPLNIISMTMDKILFEFNKTKSISENIITTKSDKIFENIVRIKNIIDHVRAFSRNKDDYILSEFCVNSSIEKTISMISEQLKFHDIKLTLTLKDEIPKILGNSYKFEQVLINLLVNAKDALLEKKGKNEFFDDMQISINTYSDNAIVFIEVIDNGIGIGKDDHEKILLPFFTTKEESKGTGLGLSICYQIIKEMGGTIYITSDQETGTMFKLQL